jgi:DNA processing protein
VPAPDVPAGIEPAPLARTEGVAGRLLDLLSPVPVPEDALIRALEQPAASVAEALLDLELAGRILRHPGGQVSLAPI